MLSKCLNVWYSGPFILWNGFNPIWVRIWIYELYVITFRSLWSKQNEYWLSPWLVLLAFSYLNSREVIILSLTLTSGENIYILFGCNLIVLIQICITLIRYIGLPKCSLYCNYTIKCNLAQLFCQDIHRIHTVTVSHF